MFAELVRLGMKGIPSFVHGIAAIVGVMIGFLRLCWQTRKAAQNDDDDALLDPDNVETLPNNNAEDDTRPLLV